MNKNYEYLDKSADNPGGSVTGLGKENIFPKEIILLVDNHSMTLEVIAGKLRKTLGAPDVYIAESVEQAVEKLSGGKYTALIIDGMEGRCEQVMEIANQLNIPIKMLSASEHYKATARKWHAEFFLKDPNLDFEKLAVFAHQRKSKPA